jgi:hypothetical protein
MLYNALPTYVHTIVATANYKWFNNTKTDSEVSSYFDRLLVIRSMALGEKPKPAHQLVAKKQNDSKKFISETHKKGKPKCLFCGNLGHKETQCRFKQKASVEAQKKAKFKTETHKNNIINIDDFSDEFERLDELPEIQEFMENMDMEVSKKDLPHPKVKQETNTLFTTGLTLEISVTIRISSESDVKSIIKKGTYRYRLY